LNFEKIISHNSATLRRLQDEVHVRWRDYKQGRGPIEEWREAVGKLHSQYDHLAFPGGLTRNYELFKAGDPNALEEVVRFLEADPLFFRSGYLKEGMIQELKKLTLTAEIRRRLQAVVIAKIQSDPTREFRRYCQLAARLYEPVFEKEIKDLRTSTKNSGLQKRWVLNYLDQAKRMHGRNAK
jgi:hypothetical protein